LAPFDKVDYTKTLNLKDGSKWLHAYVMQIDHAKGVLTLKYRDENSVIFVTDQWLDVNGESICKAGTHVKSLPKHSFAHTPASNEVTTSDTSLRSRPLAAPPEEALPAPPTPHHLSAAPPIANVPNEFICPISWEIMTDPVVCADGHSFERKEIENWLRRHPQNPTNPLTGLPLPSTALVPNIGLRNLIQEFRLQHM
jgi:hypothetical protein